jgi:hypothetical protein
MSLTLLLTGLQATGWAQELTESQEFEPTFEELKEFPAVLPSGESYNSDCCPQTVAPCAEAQSGSIFAGIEYRLIRTHFSEAVAFARVNEAIGPGGLERTVNAEELEFDYESSPRFFIGYRGEVADLRFSYWQLDSDVHVGDQAGPAETFVDPFGGTARPGSTISTSASVEMNVFDFEYVRPLNFCRPGLGLIYTAGLRFAEIDQYYDSSVDAVGGNLPSEGVFSADFSGVGPYVTLTGQTYHGHRRQFSLLAKGGMALLVGQHELGSAVTFPGLIQSEQNADRTRVVPVLESELGGAWRPSDRLTISAGWLVQSWLNMGTSGGTFYGNQMNVPQPVNAFVGADDSDIMSFDGLFVRAEMAF